MGLAKFVFGSLSAILLCFPLTMKATDDCCNGYRIKDEYPVKMIQVQDESKCFKFSDDFGIKFNPKCDLVMQGCVTVPEAETLTLHFNATMQGLLDKNNFDDPPMDVCDEIEDAASSPEAEQMACILEWFSGNSCPIKPKGPICNKRCGTNGLVQSNHMKFLYNNTLRVHLKLVPDGKLTELKLEMELEKCE